MIKLTDPENQITTYTYDAVRLTTMSYPNGWNEAYSYDANGQLLKQTATSGNSDRYKNENGEWVNYGAHLHFELLLDVDEIDVDEKTQKRFGLEPPFTWTSGTGFHVNPVQHLGK